MWVKNKYEMFDDITNRKNDVKEKNEIKTTQMGYSN